MTGRLFLRAMKALFRVTLSDSFRVRPRTEVSSLYIVQLGAKIQSPEPRAGNSTVLVADGEQTRTLQSGSSLKNCRAGADRKTAEQTDFSEKGALTRTPVAAARITMNKGRDLFK